MFKDWLLKCWYVAGIMCNFASHAWHSCSIGIRRDTAGIAAAATAGHMYAATYPPRAAAATVSKMSAATPSGGVNQSPRHNAGTRSHQRGYRQAPPLLGFPDCNLPVLGSVPLSVSEITEKKHTKEPARRNRGRPRQQPGTEAKGKRQSAPRPEKPQHGQPGQEKARTPGKQHVSPLRFLVLGRRPLFVARF